MFWPMTGRDQCDKTWLAHWHFGRGSGSNRDPPPRSAAAAAKKSLIPWMPFCGLCLKGGKSLVIGHSVFERNAKRPKLAGGEPNFRLFHKASGKISLKITIGGSAWQARG
jgi:hypothetical protein